ncbi:porin [Desulfocastanea catecholica]
MKKRALLMCFVALIAGQVCQVDLAEGKQVMVDAQVLEQLQQMLVDQQKQLHKLQKQVDEFQQTATAAQTQAEEAKTVAEEAKSTVQTTVGKGPIVSSGQERVKLAVSGQINRAVNVVDDGDETDVYFVDNANSNSRLRFVGTALVDDDLTLGSKFEIAFAPNYSGDVSQKDQESGDFFDERVAELFLLSKRYGALYLGKGSTASDGTAEVDLSGTDVVQYASYADIAGGMKFRDSADDALTGITVSDAFNDFDGLSRKTRLRYDLPTFYGFGLAGSVITDSRWDTALRWSGSGYGFKAGAAAAVVYINTADADYQYDGSLSVLHEDTGLNFTFSAGTKDSDMNDDPYNVWGKLGWQTTFFSVGKTSFGVDYGISENLPADGDEGYSIGLAMVQSFADYGTELYFQFRQYSLDRDASADVEDINVGTIGARVKF